MEKTIVEHQASKKRFGCCKIRTPRACCGITYYGVVECKEDQDRHGCRDDSDKLGRDHEVNRPPIKGANLIRVGEGGYLETLNMDTSCKHIHVEQRKVGILGVIVFSLNWVRARRQNSVK